MKALLERDQLNRREDDEADQPPTRLKATPETGIDINITDDETEQERSLETEATEKFQMLPGMDETGAQAAERTWNTLEPLIVNELAIAFDPRDRAQLILSVTVTVLPDALAVRYGLAPSVLVQAVPAPPEVDPE